MQLFYNPLLTSSSSEIKFSREESKHIAKVLRKKEGDLLHITNGKGVLFEAEINYANPNQCVATIISSSEQTKKPYQIHLAVAPIKMNDRYEWFLEKATEIGVDQITPIICDHSERKVIKINRFERIIQSAMKQSQQCFLPKLNPAQSLSDFLKQTNTDQLLIAHCENTNKQSLKKAVTPLTNVTMLIGPEGDFSTREIKQALDKGYIPVTLGETRLRTETAAIVATHSIVFLNS